MHEQDVDVGALVATERERLVGLCAHLTGNAEAAEDLAHETVVEAYRNAHKLHDPRGQRQWLWAIARHVCLRWTRRYGHEAARLTLLPDVEEAPAPRALIAMDDMEMDLTRAELARLLDRALNALPVQTRAALVAHYVEESSQAQVALRLGLSAGAVAMRLRRGRLSLRRLLAADLARLDGEDGGPSASTAWVATGIGCPACGRHTLEGRVIRPRGALSVRCPRCTPPGRTLSHSEMPWLHRHGGDMQATITRLLDWMHDRYWRDAPATGLVRCPGCEHPVRPVVGPLTGFEHVPQARHGVTTACARCGLNDTLWPSSQVLAHPAGRAFWTAHRRVRLLPERSVEVAGSPAFVLGLESISSASRIEFVTLQGTGAIVALHGGASSGASATTRPTDRTVRTPDRASERHTESARRRAATHGGASSGRACGGG